jgi:plastocyanin
MKTTVRRMPDRHRMCSRGRDVPVLLVLVASLLGFLPAPEAAHAQPGGWTPNTRSPWTLPPGQPAFSFAHRFELISGGDELINVPTLTLGAALREWAAVGFDFSSNTEIARSKLGGNETELWLLLRPLPRRRHELGVAVAYNTAAESFDAAVNGMVSVGRISLVPELRAFSDAFASGRSGYAAAAGAVLQLTPYLNVVGDVGRALRPDTLDAVWSAGVRVAIPGTPHAFTLHASNGGATTLQGTSHPKVLGPESVRYGFTFLVPLGTRAQWGRIFAARRDGALPSDGASARVEMRNVTFAPREIRVRVGDTVEWVNMDPLLHSVAADDGAWDSGLLAESGRYRRVFDTAGRFSYHCGPHPQMTGTVIVER